MVIVAAGLVGQFGWRLVVLELHESAKTGLDKWNPVFACIPQSRDAQVHSSRLFKLSCSRCLAFVTATECTVRKSTHFDVFNLNDGNKDDSSTLSCPAVTSLNCWQSCRLNIFSVDLLSQRGERHDLGASPSCCDSVHRQGMRKSDLAQTRNEEF